ncbi:MAG: nucleoside deaminase [Saprospiraceae bacterium]|nr:nucleoside deaminase [Saprospiraceae bacterium]
MLSIFSDAHFMKLALAEAKIAALAGEIPIGAVLVYKNQILAKTHNQTELLNDVTAHAEMLAITAGAEFLGSKYLKGCTLYVTLEPCVMCAGALRWSQIGKVIYAAEDQKQGFMRYGKDLLHPKTNIQFGLESEQSEALLSQFFTTLRKK